VVLTWILVGGVVALLVLGLVWAWRNRPVRDPEEWGEGEQTYLQSFNIANSRDFGFYKRPHDDTDDYG
jgi:hypothetical protein